MPRPSTPTRDFPSQISPTPNRTGNMGRGSARDTPMVTVGQTEVDLAGYSGTGQNSGFMNTNSQAVTKSDPTLNQKANLVYFYINEDVFHDDDASIIDGHISILTPVISKETVVDCDDDKPDLSQNDLSTISDFGVTDDSNDSFLS